MKKRSTTSTSTKRQPRCSSHSSGGRRKSCHFCRDKVDHIDYKDFQSFRRYLSDRGKIRSRRITGACRRHQNQLAQAVKRARELALLPYVSER
jgi:small subunit ribosomal protein S18